MSTKAGVWLGIGGESGVGFGSGRIEVRVSKGGEAWEWKKIPHDRIGDFLLFLNANPKARDMLLKETPSR